jgi:hypothetical protein
MIAPTERILSACGLALAVLGCATAAAVGHVDVHMISSIVITGSIAAAAVVLFTNSNVAQAIGLFATGVAAVVCQTVAAFMHVQPGLATNIGRLGDAATVAVGIIMVVVRIVEVRNADRRPSRRGPHHSGPARRPEA